MSIWNCQIVIIRSVFVIELSVLSAIPEFIHELPETKYLNEPNQISK